MKAVIQRVSRASVQVDGKVVGQIRDGLLVLLGVAKGDTEADLTYLVDKIPALRIFSDEKGKMNRSLGRTRRRPPRDLPIHAARRYPEGTAAGL